MSLRSDVWHVMYRERFEEEKTLLKYDDTGEELSKIIALKTDRRIMSEIWSMLDHIMKSGKML